MPSALPAGGVRAGVRTDPGRRWQVPPEDALPHALPLQPVTPRLQKRSTQGGAGRGRAGSERTRLVPERHVSPATVRPACAATTARLTGFELRLSVRPDLRPPQRGECAESLQGTGSGTEGTGNKHLAGSLRVAATLWRRGWVCPGKEPEVLALDDSALRGRGAGGPRP